MQLAQMKSTENQLWIWNQQIMHPETCAVNDTYTGANGELLQSHAYSRSIVTAYMTEKKALHLSQNVQN